VTAIRFKHVSKRYENGALAVDDVSFEVADAAFCVLLGPSGCGKSTLLRMLAGLEGISSGEVHVGDRLVNNLSPKDRDIAMVFQNYALYPHLSVLDNIAFPLEARGVGRKERRERAAKVGASVQLDGLLERRPAELSGGQRQRVALARAIIREPKAFLFDEPLSNLDAKMRQSMRAELRSLHRRLGVTSIYVTHDQEEAMALADQIVVMSAGKVRQIGPPMEVYNAPADRFVAGFVGVPAMNFFEGRVTIDAAGVHFVCEGNLLPLPRVWADKLAEHKSSSLALGVRPTALRVVKDGPGLSLRVRSIELLGDQADVHALGPGNVPVIARVSSRLDVREGDTIRAACDPVGTHVFHHGPLGELICGHHAEVASVHTSQPSSLASA
jgi:sn-glycerol 3-phosphate transport system ATP-binding protein